MERDDLLMLLRELSEGLLSGEMRAALYARTVEGLISSNLDTVPDLEPMHMQLADYGVRGAATPVTEDDLLEVARQLVALAQRESAGR